MTSENSDKKKVIKENNKMTSENSDQTYRQ